MERKIYFTTVCAAKQQRRVGAEKESELLRSLRKSKIKQQSEARYHSDNFPFLSPIVGVLTCDETCIFLFTVYFYFFSVMTSLRLRFVFSMSISRKKRGKKLS